MGQNATNHSPAYEAGYDDGFADGVNDVAADLIAAARAVLSADSPGARARLRAALAAAERKT